MAKQAPKKVEVSRGWCVMDYVTVPVKKNSPDTHEVLRPVSGWFASEDAAEQYLAMWQKAKPINKAYVTRDSRRVAEWA